MVRVRSVRWLTVLAIAVLCAGLVASCSSGPGTSTRATPQQGAPASPAGPSSPGEPTYCAPVRQLESDLRALGAAGGLTAIQDGVARVRADVTALQTAAQAEFGPQIAAMRTSLTKFATALQTAASNLNTATLTAVVGAGADVVSSYGALKEALSQRCG